MENAEIIKHEEQIKTLFSSVADIKEEVSKIHDLTAQIATISAQIENLSKRLLDNNNLLERQIDATTQRVRSLEEDRSFKAKYIWQTVAGTIIGALVGYLVNLMLK
ncbi:MAG: hypothetical protein IKE09_00670 [Clostridiales bacterium]|nr:hypothetical protein [Clostridiales bacterium]